ncbi:endo-1,4-beta-xylanase [Candidatus Saccharibacteria bacterium]|nr:endo-1,4-beta-xylanase [Candidatus Saccharibacteria bacterium]
MRRTRYGIFKLRNTKNRLFYFGGVIIAALVCAFVLWQVVITRPVKVDWLNQSDWMHFTGAEKVENGVKISPTGRVINHRDTSTAQPNPPVNIRGSHLKVSGDFQIDMELSGANNEATVQFYGKVPVIYDEWRQERPSIRLIVKNDGLYAAIWDGTSATSMDERFYAIDIKNEASITLARSKGNFIMKAGGRNLGIMPDHNIFADNTVWFGADAKSGTEGWTLTSLTAKSSKKTPLELVSAPSLIGNRDDPNTLHNLSVKNSRKLPIGAAVSIGPLLTDNQYRNTALSQFSMITPENSFKPQVIHPREDLYLFKDSDTLVEAAEKNQMIVHGHSLVMGKANPEWMQKSPEEKRKQIMIDHVSAIVGHYKGRVAQWDVVNEPLSEDDVDYEGGLKGMRKQMWFDAMGEEYIDIAFSGV